MIAARITQPVIEVIAAIDHAAEVIRNGSPQAGVCLEAALREVVSLYGLSWVVNSAEAHVAAALRLVVNSPQPNHPEIDRWALGQLQIARSHLEQTSHSLHTPTSDFTFTRG